ncbi:tetratricopeptide repeat protein, partial [Streptomyces laculatispora]|nr:tetratricopeptide repeat protein [Streptomyces laculatispora]
ALYRAELTQDLVRAGLAEEAAAAGHQVLDLLDQVRSSRIRAMLAGAVAVLRQRGRGSVDITDFLDRHRAAGAKT